MRKLVVGVLILFITGFVVNDADAQFSKKRAKSIRKNNKRMSNFKGKKNGFDKSKKYNYVGVTLNSFNYFGDISPLPQKISTDIGFTRPAFGITFGHRFGPRYTVRGEFRYGSLLGSDFESADPNDETSGVFRYVRNLQFRNRIKELTITGVFDLFKNSSTYINRAPLTPYVFLGVTVFHHNPQAFVGEDSGLPEAGTWVDLQPLGTEGQNLDLPADHPNSNLNSYSNIQVAIPFGIGGRYKLNEVMDFSFEMGIRYLFTDYIDDVSGQYVDVTSFSDPLTAYLSDRSIEVNDAVSGAARVITSNGGNGYGAASNVGYNVRGNSNDNDFYFVTTFRLTYVLGGSFRKAKFR